MLTETRFSLEPIEQNTLTELGAQRLVALSVLRHPCLSSGRVFFDVARMDKPALGLDHLVETTGTDQLVLGTNVPFFYPAGAIMNLAYRSFSEEVVADILAHNYQANAVYRDAVDKLHVVRMSKK